MLRQKILKIKIDGTHKYSSKSCFSLPPSLVDPGQQKYSEKIMKCSKENLKAFSLRPATVIL